MITNSAHNAYTNGHGSSPSHRLSPVLLHMVKITTARGQPSPIPDQFRSESRSGLTRQRVPISPRGRRDTMSNCDHQPMQRIYRSPRIAPAQQHRPDHHHVVKITTAREQSSPIPDQIRSIPRMGRVRLDRPVRHPRGDNGPSCRIAATSTYNAHTYARVIKPIPSTRIRPDHHCMVHDRPRAVTAHTVQIRSIPKTGRV
jgi:hypothetical protein